MTSLSREHQDADAIRKLLQSRRSKSSVADGVQQQGVAANILRYSVQVTDRPPANAGLPGAALALAGNDVTIGYTTMPDTATKIRASAVNVYYGAKQALFDVSLEIGACQVTALIGPSGCGKSTFLRCLNRMNDVVEGCRITGTITLDGQDMYAPSIDVVHLRRRVGMVFQKPNPFPKSIFENVAYGAKIHGLASRRSDLEQIVEQSLQKAGLWNEVKDRLTEPGTSLSGGQQQRLCIARAIAVSPEVILMDEPCSALDPIATARIEELMDELRNNYTIVIVTHSMQQAARVSQRTAFFHMGQVIEVGATADMFTKPKHEKTQGYITGRFG